MKVLEWSGDRDFTGDLDIRNFAGYITALTDGQPVNTASLWRIRYHPDDTFETWMTDNRILRPSDGEQDPALPSNATAELSGPLRDGIMYGMDVVDTSTGDLTAAVDSLFLGTRNLTYWNTNGQPGNRFAWTQEDWPGNPVAIPWVLETGCTRCGCGCLSAVNWPVHKNWHYDPICHYDEIISNGECVYLGGPGGGAIDPSRSTLVSESVKGCRNAVTFYETAAIHWPGDEAEPNHEAVCPPSAIVWTNGMQDPVVSGGVAGPTRWKPGEGYGGRGLVHIAHTLADQLIGNVGWLVGWTGKLGHNDMSRAARGDAADIANVDCLWLVPTQQLETAAGYAGTVQDFVSTDVDWLNDWLALGGKTLLIDCAARCDASNSGSGGYTQSAAGANLLLGALGSSLSFYEIEIWNPALNGGAGSYDNLLETITCDSTATHSLAPDPEELFETVPNWSPWTGVHRYGSMQLALPRTGCTGGTTLYEYNATDSVAGAVTHPVIAVEETGGNRIVACSIGWTSPGNFLFEAFHKTPNINGFLERLLTTI